MDDFPREPAAGSDDDPLPPRFILLLALLTLAGWGLAGLGIYALAQAWLKWRALHLAQAVMPLLLGGALSASTARAWRAVIAQRRQRMA